LLAFLVVLSAVGGIEGMQFLLSPVSSEPQRRLLTVPPGASLSQIAHQLKQAGLVRNEPAFLWLAWRQGRAGSLRAGHYELSPHLSPQEILNKLAAGEVARRKVTFPEGLTLRQMAERVETAGLGRAARYRTLAEKQAARFGLSFIPTGQSLEGYLFPDTYQLPLGSSEEDLIEMQLRQFRKVFDPLARQYPTALSVHEVVTLASLIEREAKQEAERRLIAGVLTNRLKKGWPLECDATVQYARGEHKARLLYRDLDIASPYNTYRHKGLPPGPIANPGRASLEAALNPAETDYLYYVARPEGTHVFSRTYAEHQRAKREIRRRKG